MERNLARRTPDIISGPINSAFISVQGKEIGVEQICLIVFFDNSGARASLRTPEHLD